MKFFARHAVAATTLAVAGFSAAQAQPIASMQLDLSDLKVEVVSLVPGAPAVQPPTISLFSSEEPSGSSLAMVGLQSTILRTSGETATFWTGRGENLPRSHGGQQPDGFVQKRPATPR